MFKALREIGQYLSRLYDLSEQTYPRGAPEEMFGLIEEIITLWDQEVKTDLLYRQHEMDDEEIPMLWLNESWLAVEEWESVEPHDNVILSDGSHWVIFSDHEAATAACRDYWRDLAVGDPQEFVGLVNPLLLIYTDLEAVCQNMAINCAEHFSDAGGEVACWGNPALARLMGYNPTVAYWRAR